MKNYIGLSTSPHDTGLAVVDRHGELVFAEAAERPLQIKRAWGIAPDHIGGIGALLAEHCDPALDTVAAWSWSERVANLDKVELPTVMSGMGETSDSNSDSSTMTRDAMTREYMGLAHKSVLTLSTSGLELAMADSVMRPLSHRYYDHHLTHAATAAFASPYEEGVCAVIDGFGEKSSFSVFEFRDGKFTQVPFAIARSVSLGLFFSLMCETCGFDHMKGEEWKVMGLAAYGKFDQKIYDVIRPLVEVNGLILHRGVDVEKNYAILREMRRPSSVPAIEYADFAATAQYVFTESVHRLLNNLYQLKLSENLILSGGCALNSSTNGTIVESTPFKNLFVNSAPADDGNAIGAAFLAYYAENPYAGNRRSVLSPYTGSRINGASLDRLVRHCGFRSERLEDDALFDAIAKALAAGSIVGWVQGRAEFGPRALGNRSILADPRSSTVKEKINAEVKFREEFRPFAPSILHERGDEFFENYQFSPYMERTLKFRDSAKEKVPGVVHVDGTGRLQSVTAELNPRYYRLIAAFGEITGIPILLNTSFNVMGKPIVHSVEDAVAVFQTSGLDVLVIDNLVFWKS